MVCFDFSIYIYIYNGVGDPRAFSPGPEPPWAGPGPQEGLRGRPGHGSGTSAPARRAPKRAKRQPKGPRWAHDASKTVS